MKGTNNNQSTVRGTPREGHRTRDRGVSDVLSFVLIFTVVLASGSLVATAGVDQLTELRDFEQIQSSERAMDVAAADLNSLQEGNPATDLEFALNGGNLWINESSLRVNVSGTGTDTDSINGTYQVNSLEHRLSRGDEDVTVAYESGAVVRSDGAGLRHDPRWRNGSDTAIVTIVSLREGSETIDIGGGGFSEDIAIDPRRGVPEDAPARDPGQTVRLVAESNATEQQQWYVPLDEQTGNVTVDVSETAHPDQWKRSLDRAGWENLDDEYKYKTTADESILIRHVVVELS